MKVFAEKINWDEALSPAPSYSQISYRRKQDRRDFLINAPLGLKRGLSGPNGYNPGQGVGLLLDRIAFPESGISSFDDLPIPFRCVATDMQSGDEVILHDGSLSQAVRASMAIPGMFTPGKLTDACSPTAAWCKTFPWKPCAKWIRISSSLSNCVFRPATSRN
jgi:NTE family protein